MSRRCLALSLCGSVLLSGQAAAAQEALDPQTGSPPDSIDILVEPETDARDYEDCSADQDAATITGEIVVCRRDTGGENRLYSDDEAKDRHAERTKGRMPMDVNLDFSIPMVGVTMSAKGCFVPPCPPPAAIIIDLEAIPEAPEGSDADRIGRGLAPLGEDIARAMPSEEELGLPPPPEHARADAVSPSGSASPAEEPSG